MKPQLTTAGQPAAHGGSSAPAVSGAPAEAVAGSDCILRARGVALALESRLIFDEVDVSLARGEVVSLLGPSGAGKSSLLRVLAGLRAPTRGTVELHGSPLRAPARPVALAFQAPTLLPWLTVEQNVALGLRFERPAITRAERKRRAREVLDEVGLLDASGLRPRQLSGGMAQRCALARCLARRPEVLLLDEPFSALDEITRADLHALLRRIVSTHATATLLVTHDIDEALLLSDRVLVLGGEPARVVSSFEVAVPEPRTQRWLELEALRVPIISALSQSSRRRRDSAPLPTPRGEHVCATTTR
jgi:NitT/TauT family transport system ATP-binding protein